MVTRQIEKAQRKVEAHNFDIRKQLLQFDDVANDQRKVIYQQRTEIMGTAGSVRGDPRHPARRRSATLVDQYMPKHAMPSDWDLEGLAEALAERFQRRASTRRAGSRQEPELEEQALRERVVAAVQRGLRRQGRAHRRADHAPHREGRDAAACSTSTGASTWPRMDYLRQGIHLRGYAQKDYRTSTSARPSSCSPRCSIASSSRRPRLMAKIEVRTQEEIDREEEERRAASDARAAGAARRGAVRCSRPSEQPPPLPAAARRTRRAAAARSRPRPAAAARCRSRSGTFVRNERKVGPQRAVPVRLGQEVQALPRRAVERRVATARAHVRSRWSSRRALYDATGRVLIAERPAGKAHGRPLGVSRRQGRRRRESERDALGARAARGARHRGARGRAAACA